MQMPLVLTNRRRRGGSASAPAFSPSTLFSSTAIGIWLDPSDLSTMFSDRAGTTPVTTPGTVVGLRLDKSKGLALGAELVTTANTAAAWTPSGSNTIAQDGDAVQITYVSSAFGATCSVAPQVVGRTYKLTCELKVNSGSSVNAYISGSGSNVTFATITSTGYVTFTAYWRADLTSMPLAFTGMGAGEVVWIRNISVRELPGNHAQAPTDAARPTYGVEPKGGRRNLLLATDTLATQSLTVTAVEHVLSFTGTGTVTLSGASIAGPLIGTGAGNRVSLTFTPTAASLTLTVVGSVTLGQLELGSSVTAYQKVVTAYDITESGVATTHYVQYDGSDDSMSTAAIDFTGTDKMSVFAGVRKLGVGGFGTIVELSASTSLNNGAFVVLGPNGTTNDYGFVSRGTALSEATVNGYESPMSNILTGLGNISGDTSTLRLDGTQVAQATTDQGTGNYGNYAMFFGRRNNASLPFNGRDFGIIIVGKAASAGEITDTETWLAARTSGVTI